MIIVLTGPTGSGKSEVAIHLAKTLNGEIINADAFQVYEGITIATAAPTEAMKQQVPHHLYGHVALSESYDIHRYQKEARAVLADVLSRQKTPIFVGGSGLYLRSALYDYDLSLDVSAVDLTPYEALDNVKLHEELAKLDPQEAQKIPEQNRRRVLRAIAICLASGKSKTALLAEQRHEPIYPTRFFILSADRASLYEKCDQRVEQMFDMGLVEQTRPLIEKYGEAAPAFRAIGINELFPYLHEECSLEECKAQIKTDTRHYIKRQFTFFAHQFHAEEVHSYEEILKKLKL